MKQDINSISICSHFFVIVGVVIVNAIFHVFSVFLTISIAAAILVSLYLNLKHGNMGKTVQGRLVALLIAAYGPLALTIFIIVIDYRTTITLLFYLLIMLRNPLLGFGPSVLNGLVSALCFIFLAYKIFYLSPLEILLGSAVFLMAAILSWVLTHRLWVFEQQSTRDGLTGLKNYRSLSVALRKEIGRCLEEGRPISLLMIDIDNFKKYNDKMGHMKGDSTLKLVAKIMTDNIRDSDMIFRYGGEEFCVLLPGVGLEKTFSIAERIRAQVEDSFSNHGFPVTVSIGVSSSELDIRGPRQLLETADKALYRAKILKNRVVAYQPAS